MIDRWGTVPGAGLTPTRHSEGTLSDCPARGSPALAPSWEAQPFRTVSRAVADPDLDCRSDRKSHRAIAPQPRKRAPLTRNDADKDSDDARTPPSAAPTVRPMRPRTLDDALTRPRRPSGTRRCRSEPTQIPHTTECRMYAARRAAATHGFRTNASSNMDRAPRQRLPTIVHPYPTRDRSGAATIEPTRPPSAEIARIRP